MEQNNLPGAAGAAGPGGVRSGLGALKNREKAVRRALSRKNKVLAFAAAAVLAAAGAGLLTAGAQSRPITRTQPLYSAKITVDAAYRVHLLPNELYPEEWLPEGAVYAEALTDYIELTPTAVLKGSEEAAVKGSYQLTAVLEGYRTVNEQKQVVYRQSYPLQNGSVNRKTAEAQLTAPVRLSPAEYRAKAQQANAILQSSPSTGLSVICEGFFSAETADGQTQKEFRYEFSAPLGSGTELYELPKPEPTVLAAEITKEVTTPGKPNGRQLALGAFCLLCGAGIAWYLVCRTRPQTEPEKYRDSLRERLRRYGGRMVAVRELPAAAERETLCVAELAQLVLLAEEVQQPVLYAPELSGLPQGGIFCVMTENKRYVYAEQQPVTT